MNETDLKNLRQKLPRGSRKKIAELAGVHPSAVYQALNGIIDSPKIIDVAIEIASEEEKNKKQREKRLKTLS